MSQDSIKSLMNSRVISVLSDTPILTAIDIILTNNFNGVPVTDKDGVLIGILTKYDLIVNRFSIRDDMKVRDLMNNDPLFLAENANIEDAVKEFADHHRVDPIPIVSPDKKVVGIISRYDMVRMFKGYGMDYSELSGIKTAVKNKVALWQWLAAICAAGIGLYIILWLYFF